MSVASKIYKNNGNYPALSLVPQGTRTILDIGCGAGDNAAILKQRGIVVDGITLSSGEAATASAACRTVLVHDLEKGLPPGLEENYDCCLCSHVLEHLCWPGRLLDDARRLLSPANGLLIVALPNFLFVNQRIRLLRGNFRYDQTGLWDETHFRWYTFQTGREMLETRGYEVIHASAVGYFPLGFARRIAPKLAKYFDSWVCHIWPGLFGWQFLYIARPKQVASSEKQ